MAADDSPAAGAPTCTCPGRRRERAGRYHRVVPIRVAFIAAECEPWAKTGGLADVVDALARALGAIGEPDLETPIDVFLPRYASVAVPPGAILAERSIRVPDPAAVSGVTVVRVIDVAADGYRLRLIDHPASFARSAFYGDADGDYPDNARRFGLLCRAALEILRAEGRPPDVVHLHDWHTGPALLFRDGTYRDDPDLGDWAALLTVHNLAYHGWVEPDRVAELGLPAGSGLDLLRSGIERAELVNTVSPGFAEEARTPAFGMGLDDALRARGDRFIGILNGLDTALWDPATDASLAARYSATDRTGKAACRGDLLERNDMDPSDDGPVLGMIGRLDPQKGFDLVAAAAPDLIADGFRLILQGNGVAALLDPFRALARARPGRVALIERFDRDMARRIYAGADGFLMPSRFEPCGTGQMIALRYGTPPIVHATGGLRDTVVDEHDHPGAGTGFVFRHADATGLSWACREFAALRQAGGPAWEGLLDRGMAVDFDWRAGSAPAYVAAYRRALAIRRGG